MISNYDKQRAFKSENQNLCATISYPNNCQKNEVFSMEVGNKLEKAEKSELGVFNI